VAARNTTNHIIACLALELAVKKLPSHAFEVQTSSAIAKSQLWVVVTHLSVYGV
jgi:hypothetical protein